MRETYVLNLWQLSDVQITPIPMYMELAAVNVLWFRSRRLIYEKITHKKSSISRIEVPEILLSGIQLSIAVFY